MLAYLDGNIIKDPGATLKNPSITLRRHTETGTIGFSFTGELEFSGTEYEYLKVRLIDDINSLDNKVVLKFVNDCCATPQEYEFNISFQGLKWCENSCTLSAAAVEKTTADDALTCLKNTMIYDNYAGFKSKLHPRISYCNEMRPNWMHDCMLIFFVATATSITSFIPVIAILALLFNLINGIIAWLNSNLSTSFTQLTFLGSTAITWNDLNNWVNILTSFIVGCGRKHPSPLVRDYAVNVCGKCGLNFKSSIFMNPSSPYYNLVYMSAPINKGTQEADTTTFWLDDNAPLLNGPKFFNELKSVFNADWRIEGADVIFERRDYFIPKTPWLDLTVYPKVTKVCWNWSHRSRWALASLYYQKDGINWVGGEAIRRWGDVVEWNSPYTPLQKDIFEPLIQFAACRFRNDGIDRDVLTTYDSLPTIGPMIKKYENSIIMNSHNCYTPMLLIWDGKSVLNATVSGTATYFAGMPDGDPSQNIPANCFYNYPMWIREGYPGNLYDNFWAIEDPRTSGYQGKDFTAELQFDCALLDLIDLDGNILTSYGMGKINEININFDTNTMVITGTA